MQILVLKTLQPMVIHPSNEDIKKAMLFRKMHKKQNLSYADCLGYQVALNRGIKFLTGDIQFKNFPEVEFVR